jgi:hypothetical protein
MEIQTNNLYVLDFHPIHIFLNTDCEQTYQTAKPFYHNTSELAKYKNTTKKGARDMLIKLLKMVQATQKKSLTLYEYCNQLVENKYE